MKKKVFFVCFSMVFLLSSVCLVYAQPSAGPGGGSPMRYDYPYDYPPSHPWGMGYGRHQGPRMHGRGYSQGGEGWFCPWCGQERPHRDRSYDPDYDRRAYRGGRGMMMPHHRWAPRYNPPRYPDAKWWGKGLSKTDAETLLNKELGISKNPNLKWGKITEHETYWEAELLTKNNDLVDRVQVHKYTGWFRSAYDEDE